MVKREKEVCIVKTAYKNLHNKGWFCLKRPHTFIYFTHNSCYKKSWNVNNKNGGHYFVNRVVFWSWAQLNTTLSKVNP